MIGGGAERNLGDGEMSKHTPGPWLISRDKFGEINIETSKRGGCVFVIANDVGGEVRKDEKGKWSDKSEVEANARLIEAAPELLEALEKLLACWRSTCSANGWDPDHVVQATNAADVIAKATGAAE